MQSANISRPPVGSIIQTSTSVAPYGYIKCNGAAIDRTIYSALFSVIGTTYGAGNGSTTFNVPDYRGCFLRGLDESRGLDSGRTMGSYQADDNQSHTHSWYSFNIPYAFGSNQNAMFNASSVNSGSAGGNENRPKNYAVVYWIKH